MSRTVPGITTLLEQAADEAAIEHLEAWPELPLDYPETRDHYRDILIGAYEEATAALEVENHRQMRTRGLAA